MLCSLTHHHFTYPSSELVDQIVRLHLIDKTFMEHNCY